MSTSFDELPQFLGQGADRLFTFLHAAAGTPRATLVFCHALAEEKLWSHRVYVTFARELARAGYAVLRFDTRGEGDSGLEFEESTIESRVADTLRAVEAAQAQSGAPVVLVGHRLGAMIASLAAQRAPAGVRALALWDPVTDGEDYLGQMLRSNLATQMATQGKVTRTREVLTRAILEGETVIVDGYGLSPAFCRELTPLKWAQMPEIHTAHPSLILEVPKGGQEAPSAPFTSLCATRPKLAVKLAAEPPFWRETRQFHKRAGAFTAATLEWLGSLA
jgi:exosortase A-associated hydrolase 2